MQENTVKLIGFYGSDEIHACSAWTSTSRDISEEKRARIPQLLKMLAENGHETPFEKSSLHFLVNTDIASHIHLIKHRVGVSVNAESARYKELMEDKFYVPNDWGEVKADVQNMDIYLGDKWVEILTNYTYIGNGLYHQCVKDLEPLLGRKRAKESARFFKTYNSQIEADVMFNFRSFIHFQKLRNSPHAQKEIREIANEMLRLVTEIPDNPFKDTIKAFKL